LFVLVAANLMVAACTDSEEPARIDNMENGNESVTLERTYDEVFDFEVLPTTGPGTTPESGNTADLLLNMPYLLTSGLIPPEFVINELLSQGLNDAGMSGGVQWEPYRLRPGDFNALSEALKQAYAHGELRYEAPDSWVRNFQDGHVWVMYVKHGVPWKEHKRLNDAMVAIENALQEAERTGDSRRMNELHLASLKADGELSEFIVRYLNKYSAPLTPHSNTTAAKIEATRSLLPHAPNYTWSAQRCKLGSNVHTTQHSLLGDDT
jgi:hypothetical protein